MTDKPALRQSAINTRDAIPAMPEMFTRAADNFIAALKPEASLIVALYWPKGPEFDTRPLLERLEDKGVSCGLPVIEKGQRVLKFAAYQSGDPLEVGPFAVAQPASRDWVEPDIFVIPLLAFDRNGHRLGYGAGHYDATLAHYRAIKPVLAVGYGYDAQELNFDLPAEAHDEKMDWIVTPTKAMRFS